MAVKGVVQRLLFAVVPRLYRVFTALLFSTYRVDISGRQYYEDLTGPEGPCVGVIWHYSVLYTLSFMKGENWVAMVSTSGDAEYISRYLEQLKMTTVRGSSNRGGVGALKALLKEMKRHKKNAAIVADGSQGPALKAQSGAILAASRTRAPILPLVWSAQKYWAVNSWDKTVIPKPFSKVKVLFGKPLHIPAKIRAEEIEKYTRVLEEVMLELYRKAWGEYGVKTHG